MNQGRTVNKIFESKLERSSRGRLRFKWLEDKEKDLWKMKVKRWQQNAVNKEEQASIIKEAKLLRGSYMQGVINQVRKVFRGNIMTVSLRDTWVSISETQSSGGTHYE
jgi:hypothetical protein